MDGGTTVSGTMVVSALAGIEVFVTGGIGGVHRGGAQSLDISAGGQHYHRMFMKIGVSDWTPFARIHSIFLHR